MTAPAAPVLSGRSNGDGTIRLSWPPVAGALSYDLYRTQVAGDNPAARNEKQTVTVDASGGTFKLTYSAQQTAAIAWDADAAAIQSALEALSNLAPGDVVVTQVVGATIVTTVEFAGTLARTNVTQMTADSTSLTGGTHTATVATAQQGLPRDTADVDSPLYLVSATGRWYFGIRAVNADGSTPSNEVVLKSEVPVDHTSDGTTAALRINRALV